MVETADHTEFGMAIALEKNIYVYHEGNLLQTTFYHLPEINIFEGDAKRICILCYESCEIIVTVYKVIKVIFWVQ